MSSQPNNGIAELFVWNWYIRPYQEVLWDILKIGDGFDPGLSPGPYFGCLSAGSDAVEGSAEPSTSRTAVRYGRAMAEQLVVGGVEVVHNREPRTARTHGEDPTAYHLPHLQPVGVGKHLLYSDGGSE